RSRTRERTFNTPARRDGRIARSTRAVQIPPAISTVPRRKWSSATTTRPATTTANDMTSGHWRNTPPNQLRGVSRRSAASAHRFRLVDPAEGLSGDPFDGWSDGVAGSVGEDVLMTRRLRIAQHP